MPFRVSRQQGFGLWIGLLQRFTIGFNVKVTLMDAIKMHYMMYDRDYLRVAMKTSD